ncbi:MAG TPA: hypothetical protein VHD56_08720 [Tepidisphaeraceae bacterium]|nr:hypothetical protein [Tepidisphaeraceae bacterium]
MRNAFEETPAIKWWSAITCLLTAAAIGLPQQPAPPPTPAQEQPEVLTSGPVNEAFAEPVDMDTQNDGQIVPTAPPPDINETPPDERPEGDQYDWVPGYWSWEPQRNTYIWVSGCWRAAPPNTYWVPGYWTQVSGGYEWVPGFWSSNDSQEIEYLPTPPSDLDTQPPGDPPSPDNTWVPPCWYWRDGQYVQRNGYWLEAHPGWVWNATHYTWTPRGYVMVNGYWDYTIQDRGLLFAPVVVPANSIRVGFSYSPSTVIDVGLMTDHLFVSPRSCHYYFGDYYDDAYISVGIYPWFDRVHVRAWYDPIYEYDRWHFRRTEPRWEERERRDYEQLRANRDLRPPRTFREMETRLAKAPEPQRKNIQVAQTINNIVVNENTTNVTNIKLTKVNVDARQKIVEQARTVQTFRQDRSKWENKPAAAKAMQPTKEERNAVAAPPAADRKEPVAQPAAGKQAPAASPAPAPAARNETPRPQVQRPAENSQPSRNAQPQEPGDRRNPPAPAARNEEARPAAQLQSPVVQPAPERANAAPPSPNKADDNDRADRKPNDNNKDNDKAKAPAAAAIERKPEAPPRQREVRVTQPEREKVTAPPSVAKAPPADAKKAPPPRPNDEQKGDPKDNRKDNNDSKK